ncbi:MAG: hypothetical protein ACTH9H_11410 [Galactobacter sp.]
MSRTLGGLPVSRRPAWVLGAVGLIFGLIYIETYSDPLNYLAHREAAVSWTAMLLIFSCAVSGVACAMEAGRDRASQGPLHDSTRARWVLVANRVWPGITAGWLVQTLWSLWTLAKAGSAPDMFPLHILLALFAPILLHGLLGYALGAWLKPLFAVPLTLLVTYCWLGFVSALAYLPVGNLPGLNISDCCSADTTLAPGALWALVVFSLIASLAVLLGTPAMGRPRRANRTGRRWRAGASVLVLGAAFGMALPLADGLGADVTRAVSRQTLDCRGEGPQVCLTAVQRARFDPTADIQAGFRALHQAGLPQVITVAPGGKTVLSEDGVADVMVDPAFDQSALAHSVASTYETVLENKACFDDGPAAGATQQEQDEYAESSEEYSNFATLIGMWSERRVDRELGLEPTPEPDSSDFMDNAVVWESWQNLAKLPQSDQRKWISQAFAAMNTCRLPAVPNHEGV